MSALRGVRERARAEATAEIVAAARRQLADVGAADLSLRAVARELDVVSSAVYRYVSSRDELLTLLIVEAYDSLGDHVERVVAGSAGRPPAERWVDAALAVRSWAMEHRHEHALLYGTPVPGYDAPERTTASGTRVSFALVGIVRDAWRDGLLTPRARASVTSDLAADLDELRTALDLPAPDSVLVATLAAWSQVFGLITFELFGQTRGVIEHHEDLFRATATMMASQLGLASDAA